MQWQYLDNHFSLDEEFDYNALAERGDYWGQTGRPLVSEAMN